MHAIAYNVMLIGGVSTLLFNGNPLLRFDGYYVFSDWIEIPNLGSRATRHLGYLVQKYLFGVKDAEQVTSIRAERNWFILYGIAAFIYRMFIMFAIIAYIAGRFFIVGVVMAIWAITTQMLLPLSKSISFLANGPKLRSNRPRAILTTLGLLVAALGLLFVMPAPSATIVEGVTWPSEQAQVRVGTNGFVTGISVDTNDKVQTNATIVTVDDPFLHAQMNLMDAELAGLEIQRTALTRSDRVEAALIAAEIELRSSDKDRLQQQIDELVVKAPRDGFAVLPRGVDLKGRYVLKGSVIGYVLAPQDTQTVRVVVGQNDVDLVRNDTQSVSVIPVEWGTKPYPATILREVPGATNQLPTPALGLAGGGKVPVDPADGTGVRTLQRYFEFEVILSEALDEPLLGRRVRVRFDHGYEPLGFQAYRSLRQLFLRLYDV